MNYNPNDDIHYESIATYARHASELLSMANKKSESIAMMLNELDKLVNPDGTPQVTYWIFRDTRGKVTHVREGSKPISSPFSRVGSWIEVTPVN